MRGLLPAWLATNDFALGCPRSRGSRVLDCIAVPLAGV